MTKCVYCSCTADIQPGKAYCFKCGHDAVAHVRAAPAANGRLGLVLVIAVAGILAAYFLMNSQPDGASGVPGGAASQASAPAGPPASASSSPATAPSSDGYVQPAPSSGSDGQSTPSAPPLGSWRSNSGSH